MTLRTGFMQWRLKVLSTIVVKCYHDLGSCTYCVTSIHAGLVIAKHRDDGRVAVSTGPVQQRQAILQQNHFTRCQPQFRSQVTSSRALSSATPVRAVKVRVRNCSTSAFRPALTACIICKHASAQIIEGECVSKYLLRARTYLNHDN